MPELSIPAPVQILIYMAQIGILYLLIRIIWSKGHTLIAEGKTLIETLKKKKRGTVEPTQLKNS
jgi:hypothetical protein